MQNLKFLIVLWLVVLSSVCIAQDQRFTIPKDSLAQCVVNLRNYKGKTGSGIFVTKDNRPFIVTAGHVAKDMDKEFFIFINGLNNNPIKLTNIQLMGGKIPVWKYHETADIAILELAPSKDIEPKLSGRFLQHYYFHNKLTAISRDVQLTVLGFPLGLGAEGRFSPFSFRTFSASGLITLPRFDNNINSEFIILENPGMGGYSGAPVFDTSTVTTGNLTMTGEGTVCYGIVHGTISDQTGGKLAAVTPSAYLFDLLK